MVDSDAVLIANEAFYAAFAAADMDAMIGVWATEGPVAVIHPGLLPITGLQAVLQSWREALEPRVPIDIVCIDPVAQIHGDVAIVLCEEQVNNYRLAASNVYRRTGNAWQMVMHQAGPVAGALALSGSDAVH